MDHLKTDGHQSSDNSFRLPRIPIWAVFAVGALLVVAAPAALALPRYTTSNYTVLSHLPRRRRYPQSRD